MLSKFKFSACRVQLPSDFPAMENYFQTKKTREFALKSPAEAKAGLPDGLFSNQKSEFG
jgi:hypothetical protein